MTPLKPYMMRALYDWIVDNRFTPYILVKAGHALDIPEHLMRDGEITLNLAPRAVKGLMLGDEAITFSARFSGVPRDIYVPVGLVAAIYAQENGRGMMFDDVSHDEPPPEDEGGMVKSSERSRPQLKVVK